MLKQDNDKVFTFDMEQALSFEGATGPYCQYAVTRLASILRKDAEGKQVEAAQEDAALVDAAQKALALKIAQLPEKVSLAAKELRPSVIAQWCLEMAQAVSAFYRDVSVLSAEGESRKVRLALVESAKIALSNGLHLLGIPTPEEM
jgi:arginyl-tRNA synthetase